MQAELAVDEYTLTPRAPEGWRLNVSWRFRNHAERPLYVLAKGPISIIDARPIVLNHAVTDDILAIDANAGPNMAFVVVEAHGHLDVPHSYPLPAFDLQEPRAVVGAFAVGYDPPDPEWCQCQMWDEVKQWQRILNSSHFRIRADVKF